MSVRRWGAGASLFAIIAAVPVAPLTFNNAMGATREAGYDFNIPRGDLASVILAIGRTSGRTIIFAPELLQGRSAGPIVGRKTVIFAISQAIAGTNLRLVAGTGGELTIKQNGPRTATAGGGGDIADIDVAGNGSALHDDGFQSGDAGVSSRLTGTPAKDVPLAISSVTSDVIQSQGVTSVQDTLVNVAGVNLIPGAIGAPEATIRGFQNDQPLGVDGDQSNELSNGIPIDDIERVDVLKGPTSILTGVTQEGGTVNIVTKKPTDQTIRDMTVRYGSNGYKTLAFDLGGIVPQTEGLTYRFVGSGNAADKSYGGYNHPHEALVAPSLEWKDKDSSVIVGFRYTDTRQASGTRAFAVNGTDLADPLVRVPRGVPAVNPNMGSEDQTLSVFSDMSHDFGKLYGIDFTVNNHVQYQTEKANIQLFQFSGSQNTNGTYPVSDYFVGERYNRLSEKADLTLKYDGGFFTQTSKFGFDLMRSKISQDYEIGKDDSANIDINTGGPYVNLPSSYGSLLTALGSYYQNDDGFYYLEKFDTFNNRLHILGSVRTDHDFGSDAYAYVFRTNGSNYSSVDNYSQHAPSWTAGGAFDLTPWMTVYGNRADGYYPVFGVNAETGAALQPQTRDLSEVGARFFLLDKRLTLTASFYKLAQTNVTESDPTDPTGLREIVIGGLASRGFEFEAKGNVLPGWDVIASFATVHAAYTDPSVYTDVVVDTPQITANIWSRYKVQSGPLAGLMFGIGAHGNTSSYYSGYDADYNTKAYKIPGYVVADAMIGYQKGSNSVQLNVYNLTDKYYYYPAVSSEIIMVGQGRNFMLTAKHSF